MSLLLDEVAIGEAVASLVGEISAVAQHGRIAIVGVRSRGDEVAERVSAALLEKKGKPDHIHASESVVALVPDEAWEKHTHVVDGADGRERVVKTFLLSV